jgi:chromosome segregation ATPase
MTTASEYLIQRNKELEAEVERLKTENARIIDEADDIRAAADEGTVLFHKIADQRDAALAEVERLKASFSKLVKTAKGYAEMVTGYAEMVTESQNAHAAACSRAEEALDQRDALQARIDRTLGITVEQIRSLIRRGVLRDDPALLIRALYHEALGEGQ